MPFRGLAGLWRKQRGEAVILAVTAVAIVTGNLFEGVLLGLLLAVCKTAWEASHLCIDVDECEDRICVRLSGHATFLRLPRMLDTLEAVPKGRAVELDLTELRHLDHACRTALTTWVSRHNSSGEVPVEVSGDAAELVTSRA